MKVTGVTLSNEERGDRYLTLDSGEEVRVNVIVGADGVSGLGRKIVIGDKQDGDVVGHEGPMTMHW